MSEVSLYSDWRLCWITEIPDTRLQGSTIHGITTPTPQLVICTYGGVLICISKSLNLHMLI